ncbi:MAG TPA: hypothetical protein VIV55_13380 [Flavobacterium sp.]
MKKIITLLFLILISTSCSKDDSSTTAESIVLPDAKIKVESIEQTTAKINLLNVSYSKDYKISFQYKKSEDQTWIEAASENLTNLDKGKKYQAKITIKSATQTKESEIVSFTTKVLSGQFYSGGNVSDVVNQECSLPFITQYVSTIDESKTPLSAYIKIGSDSLKVKKITFSKEDESSGTLRYYFKLELPENTQSFFDKDTEYNYLKNYTVGLFIGDFYTEIKESNIVGLDPYLLAVNDNFGKIKLMSVFNKIPRFNSLSYSEVKNDKIALYFKGFFWTSSSRTTNTFAVAKQTEFVITKANDPVFKKILMSNTSFTSPTCGYNSCDTEGFGLIHDINGYYLDFHNNNIACIRLYKTDFPTGDYNIEVKMTDKNDIDYKSEKFTFKIE